MTGQGIGGSSARPRALLLPLADGHHELVFGVVADPCLRVWCDVLRVTDPPRARPRGKRPDGRISTARSAPAVAAVSGPPDVRRAPATCRAPAPAGPACAECGSRDSLSRYEILAALDHVSLRHLCRRRGRLSARVTPRAPTANAADMMTAVFQCPRNIVRFICPPRVCARDVRVELFGNPASNQRHRFLVHDTAAERRHRRDRLRDAMRKASTLRSGGRQ